MKIIKAINILSRNSKVNSELENQRERQRRINFTDLHSEERIRQGDENTKSEILIRIPYDFVYTLSFKIAINKLPFESYVSGSTQPVSLNIEETGLQVSNDVITPNPHNHDITPNPHSHNILQMVSKDYDTKANIRIKINGVDITDYLDIGNDFGYYPKTGFFDIIEVCNYLQPWQVGKILYSKEKLIEISGDGRYRIALDYSMRFSVYSL